MLLRRLAPAALLAVGLGLLFTATVLAHATLVGSNPPAGAKLASAPGSVQLSFSEGVVPEFSSFTVISRARRHYELEQPPTLDAERKQVNVALQPDLPAGVYIVQWKVVSDVDGHLTRGSFNFTVVEAAPSATSAVPPSATAAGVVAPSATAAGAATATAMPLIATATPDLAPPPPPDQEPPGEVVNPGDGYTQPGWPDVLVRWLSSLLAALVPGVAGFRQLVLPQALARLRDEDRGLPPLLQRRFVMLAGGAAAGLLILLGAELLLQGARVTESELAAVLAQPGVLGGILATSFGRALEWRALGLLLILAALAAGLRLPRLRDAGWWLVALLGAACFIAQTESSHAAILAQAIGPGPLQGIAPAANVVHLLVTALWTGGIFCFVAILLPALPALGAESRRAVLRDSVTRFGKVGLLTVPLVAASGLLLYLAQAPTLATTLETAYGREVLAKIALLAILLAPAGYNLRRVGPGLARLRGAATPALGQLASAFRRSVGAEALLVSLALVFAALLTLSAPATNPAALAGAGATPVPPTGVAQLPPTAPPTSTPRPAPQPTATVAALPSATAAPVGTTLALVQTVRGVDLTLTVTHELVDDMNVQLRDAAGPIGGCDPTPAPDANCAVSVKLTITQLDDNTSFTDSATAAGDGSFALAEGPYLALDGNWQILVTVRRFNQPDDLKAAFRYNVSGFGLSGRTSDYINFRLNTDPSPPRSGPVSFSFTFSDSNGQPISDASVMMQGIMPTHGHVSDWIALRNSGGSYSGSLLMPMRGGWDLELSVARAGKDTLALEVAVDVAESEYDLTPYPTPNITPGPR